MKNKSILFLFFLLFTFANLSFASSNLIEETGLDKRLQIILKRTSVLGLSSCGLGDEEACKIAKAIKNSNVITQVNFNHNHIGNSGIQELGKAFESMRALTHVHLYGNKFDDEGAISLFLSLKKVHSLAFIDLRALSIGEKSLDSLADLLEGNPKLQIHFDYDSLKYLFK